MQFFRRLRPLWPALVLLACSETPSAPPTDPIHFSEVTAAAGIDFVHYNGFTGEYFYVETFGGGAAFFDYDGDGWLDLYLVNGTYLKGYPPDPLPVNRLYRNLDDGRFAATDANLDAPQYGFGVSAADYDSDGDQDLFVTNFTKETNNLYRNEGQGGFTLATSTAGLAGPSLKPLGFGTRFLDYDLDGDLDLFVANGHVVDQIAAADPAQTYLQPNQMFRNEGGTRYADVSAQLGADHR